MTTVRVDRDNTATQTQNAARTPRLAFDRTGSRESCSKLVLKRMTLSSFHEPGTGMAVAATITTGPPRMSTFLRVPPAMKATNRLSGDQNGASAPSVPGTGCAVGWSSRRIQSILPSLASAAAKAKYRPSGDSARGGPVANSSNVCRGCDRAVNRRRRGWCGATEEDSDAGDSRQQDGP